MSDKPERFCNCEYAGECRQAMGLAIVRFRDAYRAYWANPTETGRESLDRMLWRLDETVRITRFEGYLRQEGLTVEKVLAHCQSVSYPSGPIPFPGEAEHYPARPLSPQGEPP